MILNLKSHKNSCHSRVNRALGQFRNTGPKCPKSLGGIHWESKLKSSTLHYVSHKVLFKCKCLCEGWVKTVSAYLEHLGNLRKLGPNAENYGLGCKQSIV